MSQESIEIASQKKELEKIQVTSGDENRADRFPALWRRKDGSLLLVYQELAGEEIPVRFKADSTCHVMLTSTDEGRTWKEEKRVFVAKRASESENTSAGRPTIPGDYCRFTALPNGRVMYNGQGGRGGLLFISRNEFRDDESAWELVQPTFDRPIGWLYELRFLADGTWGMFGTWEENSEGFLDGRRHEKRAGMAFLTSKDQGRTWTTQSVLYDGKYFPYHLCEPSWVIGDDGRFYVYTREDLSIGPGVEFISKDQGNTWQARPMRFMGHHIYANRLPGGKGVLAVFRECNYRSMPAVGAWWDDGSTWGRFLHLDNLDWGGLRYYGDMSQWIESKDGGFLVAYSLPPVARYGQDVRVFLARFTLNDFDAPGIVSR